MNRLQGNHCRIQFIQSAPHGVSLIEMLVMISLISVIFTVGVTMLAFLMRVELQGTDRIHKSFNIQRLSKQFRQNIASARRASIISEKKQQRQKLKLDMGVDHFIIYSAGENSNGKFISREQIISDQLISRNEYQISEGQLHFRIENINQRQIASLQLKLTTDNSHENETVKTPYSTLQFDAVINRKYSYIINKEQ